MYRQWADSRHSGLFEIEDRGNIESFSQWILKNYNSGGHPFEILRGHSELGIHLIPPTPIYNNHHHYVLKGSYEFPDIFLKMVNALIVNDIAFKAYPLYEILEYLTDQSYFSVNSWSEHSISYDASYRKLLKHIEWDEPRMPKWK